jgi:hypothetical protein
MIHSEDGCVHDRAASYFAGDLLHRRITFALMDCSWLALHHDTLTDATTLARYHAARAVQRTMGLPMSAQFAAGGRSVVRGRPARRTRRAGDDGRAVCRI